MMLMKHRVVAMGLASLLVPIAIFGGGNSAAETPLGPLLPSPIETVIIEIPGPVKTIIERVQVPGPIRTIIVPSPVPGPVRTIYLPTPVPGPTKTVYVTSPVPSPVGQAPSPRATLSNGDPVPQVVPTPVVTVSPSPVPGKTKVVTKERRVNVSVPQAIGISIGLVLLGILLGLLALFAVYTMGYKESEREQTSKLRNLTNELFGK